MKHIMVLKRYMLFCLLSLIAFACVDDGEDTMDGVGINRFRIPNADNYSLVSLKTEAPTATILTVYRDMISNADLNQPASLTFSVSQAQLDLYNTENETELTLLDPTIYTLEGISGGKIDFAAGEAQKAVIIKVNTALMDFDNQYALPLVFTGGTYEVSGVSKYMIIEVGVKNKYDGEYKTNIETTGWSAYGIADGMPEDYSGNIGLVTTGPNTVGIANLYRGDNLLPGFSYADGATAATGFGDASPIFTFNDANKVTSIGNVYAGNARGRAFVLNPSATSDENVYDPEAKTLVLNFLFKQNGRPDMVCKWKMTFAKDRG